MIEVQQINFEEILPIWSEKLWPNRVSPIEPVTSMVYLGGYDLSLKQNPPFFCGIYEGNKLVAVNSGSPTCYDTFRSRGVWVDSEYRTKGYGKLVIDFICTHALNTGYKTVWTIPRQSAMPFYFKCGFVQTSDWFSEGVEFGVHCYAQRILNK